MKKIIFALIVLFCFLSSNIAFSMTIDDNDLVLVIYNENDRELYINLGSVISAPYTSTSEAEVIEAGVINLDHFGASVEAWEDLNMGAFSSDGSDEGNIWFVTTLENSGGMTQSSRNNFVIQFNKITSHCAEDTNLYDGDDTRIFLYSASDSLGYDKLMNSNSTAPGFYGGVNSSYIVYGEANLATLDDGGYVDIYLYHYKFDLETALATDFETVFILDTGADNTTDYTVVIRLMADGSVVINPPPPVNNPPEAVDDSVSTNEDTAVTTGSLVSNDTDADGDTLSVSSITQPANGTAVDNGNSTVTYTPDSDFHGTDSFTYTVSDGNDGTDTGTVTITVASVNDPPVAVDDSVSTNEDTAVTTGDLVSNDTDADGDTLNISSITQPANGTTADNGNNTVTYTPDSDFHGTDSFTYTVSDGNGGTDTGTVTITVASVNDPPVAVDDSVSTPEDTAVTTGSLVSNDTDVDGDTLNVSSITQPANGTAADNGNNTVTYTPDSDFHGTDSFTYIVGDGNGGTGTGTVTITVVSVNDPPVVADIPNQSIQEGDAFSNFDLDDYVTDADHTDAEITWAYSGNTEVTVALDGTTHEVTIAANEGWTGKETITFTATDPDGGTDSDTADFSVTALNAPVVGDIPDQTIAEDGAFTEIILDDYVSDDDTPDENINWTYSGDSSLSVTIDSNRVATITAPADWNGSETITFTASDGDKYHFDKATFTVTPVNDAPVVSDIGDQTINEGETFSVFNLDDFVSDVDNEDSEMTWSYSGNGELSVQIDTSNNNSVSITAPDENWNGSATITFTAMDPDGASDSDNAVFTINSVNDVPVISGLENQTIIQGESFEAFDLDDYVEDVDHEDAQLVWSYTGNVDLTVSIDENNVVQVSAPDSDWYGSEEITFTVTDPEGASDNGVVEFTIEPAPPTMPSVNSPVDGSEVTDNPPTLSVNNSTSVLGEVTYDFELATDEAFNNTNASEYDYPEGENITSWPLSERFPDLELDENSTYYWRARAQDSNTDSGWMDVASFIMNEFNEEPSTPTVSYPEPGSQVSSLTPILEITNSTDPDNDDLLYRFEVYDFEFSDNSSPGGSSIISGEVTEESDGTTSYQVASSLTDNTQYWWRVRAEEKDHDLTSAWAGPYKFTVNISNNTPTRPELVSPATNGEVDTYNPELVVSNSTDEDVEDIITYIFQIDTVNTFNSTDGGPLDEEEVSEGSEGKTSWSPSGLEENVKYYWRVKTSDGSAESGWLTSSFTVNVVNESPETPVPTYPEDEKTVHTSSITLKAGSASDPDNDTVLYIFEICESGGDCTRYEDLENPELKLTGLSNNSEYEWAVKAVDEHGAESEWSDNRIFKVVTNYTPNPPKLNNPVSGGSVYINDTIVLSVKNSTDDDGDELTYYFELYADSQLSDLIETGSVTEGSVITEYEVKSDLTADTTYYWRAYASDGDNNSSYSSTFNFICSSEEPEYEIDVVESQVVYSSMLDALEDGEYIDVTVDDEDSDLYGVTISIPAGAVDSDINITIGEATSTPSLPSGVAVTGRIVHFGPEGTVFNNPVIIKVPYTQDDLTAMGADDPLDLRLYTYSDSDTGWEILEPSSADTESLLLLFEVSHFSIFTFGVETDDTGSSSGDSSDASSGGGGGCFISTASGGCDILSSITVCCKSIWGLLLIGAFALLLFRKRVFLK